MALLEARQRAIVKIDVPEGTGIEITVGGREVPPSTVAPISILSPFIVRRGGVHPLASSPVASPPVIDELARARDFAAEHSGEVVSSEVERVYPCEADAKELFQKHGGALAARPFEADFHNMFGISLSDDEQALVNESFEGMCRDGVPRPVVERWAIESGKYPTASADAEEITLRGKNAVEGVAGLAKVMRFEVNEDREDASGPFLFALLRSKILSP